jgi:hypothetical protein
VGAWKAEGGSRAGVLDGRTGVAGASHGRWAIARIGCASGTSEHKIRQVAVAEIAWWTGWTTTIRDVRVLGDARKRCPRGQARAGRPELPEMTLGIDLTNLVIGCCAPAVRSCLRCHRFLVVSRFAARESQRFATRYVAYDGGSPRCRSMGGSWKATLVR